MSSTSSLTSPPDRHGGAPDPLDGIAALDPTEVGPLLQVDIGAGLPAAEVAERLARTGPNKLASAPGRPAWLRFVDQFRSVLVGVLAAAALVAALLGDIKDAVVVGIVLLINAVLGFVQEGRAEGALSSLEAMLTSVVRVRRGGEVHEIDAEELVPGDVVLLEAGDRVPADGRFVMAANVSVDESSLTGESVPVDKAADANPAGGEPGAGLGDQHNLGFLNTTLVRGRGELVVTRTGMATEMGRVAELLNAADPGDTPLQEQLDALGKRLAVVAGIAVSIVFAFRLFQGDELKDAVINAVALAIAAIPEGLPAVVTVTLAVGVHQMAVRQAIVKRLASVETLGATTVICSDKTGTLTLNEMTARVVVTPDFERHQVGGEGYEVDAELRFPGAAERLAGAALCSDAVVRDGELVGDPTEGALVVVAGKAGIDVAAVRRDRPRLGEVPFDSATKYMATFHEGTEAGTVDVYVKGAPDVVLGLTTADAGARDRWLEANLELAGYGMRVLAVAHRRVARADVVGADGAVADPEQWVGQLDLQALVGIIDPPRPEAREAIRLCRIAGIDVKMITGDHAVTAAAIAKDLGIQGRAVSGADLEAMTDEELAAQIPEIGVCARVAPEHKVRVVKALQANNEVVAMTGDGVNDAAALRTADIGVAMGITGTEVTKEAADMVLTDDNFATIVGAVERGRGIYDNIVKFVRFQLTTNLAAIGTILFAGVFGLPTPLSAIQVLFVNIIADGPPAMALGTDPPSVKAMDRAPRDPGGAILAPARLARLGITATVMTIVSLTTFVYARNQWGGDVALTMTFCTFVFLQLVNVLNARSENESLFSADSFRNPKLWLVVGGVAVLQVLAVVTGPGRSLFDTVTLTPGQWAICAASPIVIIASEELRKAVDRARMRSRAT